MSIKSLPKVRCRPDQSAASWPSLAQIGAARLFYSVRPRDVSEDAVEFSQAIKHVGDRPVAVAVGEKSPRSQGSGGARRGAASWADIGRWDRIGLGYGGARRDRLIRNACTLMIHGRCALVGRIRWLWHA